MKKLLSLVIMIAVCCGVFAQQEDMSQYMPKLKVGEAAPDFSLPVYNGSKKISLSDYKGKYVLLDFWASWCGDCRREMPIMEDVLKNYEGKIEVMSVSFDKKQDALEAYLKEHPVNYPVVCDYSAWKESAVAKAYQLSWIPTFYIIGPDGKIAGSGIDGKGLKEEMAKIFGCCNSASDAVLKNIMSRRSIRKYKSQPVPGDILDKIIECGLNAPNGMNAQSYEIRVVNDPESAAFLAEQLNGLYKAPVYMFIAAKDNYDMSRIDVGLLSENICLSAWAYGIGSINLGMPLRALKNKPEILKKLDFSEGHGVCLVLALGYPDETPAAKPRKAERVKFVTVTAQ